MKEFSEDNLKADIHLDLGNLDIEIQKQPGLYMYWAEKLADAKKNTGYAGIAVKVRLGELEKEWRKSCLPSGNKATEASIKAELESDPEIKELRKAETEAWHAQGLLEATVRALDHKKAQLDSAVRLHCSGYFQDRAGVGSSDNAESQTRRNLNRQKKEG